VEEMDELKAGVRQGCQRLNEQPSSHRKAIEHLIIPQIDSY
jgi:hypothetical protein